MSSFDIAVNYVIAKEGGLNIDQNDAGGITNHGISLRFLKSLTDARKYGFDPETINSDTIRDLTLTQAKGLYKGEFWNNAPFERINNQNNANFIFDMAINMGIHPAIKSAQRACWAVKRKRNIIVDDGILGEKTIKMINECGVCLLPAMRSERAGDYRVIIERNQSDLKFQDGWMNRAYGV